MMRALLHVIAGLVGVGLVASVANSTINATGGYGSDSAWLTIALACGLIAGSTALGIAWREKRRALAIFLCVCMLASEAYALLKIAEITMAERERTQAPLIEREKERAAAETRLDAVRAALVNAGKDTPRLTRALAAKADADATVLAKAAEKGCAVNCKELLNKQVEIAAAEVAEAREEITLNKQRAERDVATAQAALDKIPAPESASPLADRLGMPQWALDILFAALRTVGLNGLAAALVAFAAHGWHRRREADPAPAKAEVIAPAVDASAPKRRSVRAQKALPAPQTSSFAIADRFAAKAFRPDPEGQVRLNEIPKAYHRWCSEQDQAPLPDNEFGAALSEIFAKVGLYRVGHGAEAVIEGIAWREPLSEVTH